MRKSTLGLDLVDCQNISENFQSKVHAWKALNFNALPVKLVISVGAPLASGKGAVHTQSHFIVICCNISTQTGSFSENRWLVEISRRPTCLYLVLTLRLCFFIHYTRVLFWWSLLWDFSLSVHTVPLSMCWK